MFKIAKYTVLDLLRSRAVLAYTLVLLAASLALFSLEADSGKAMLSLLNVVLLLVPLVAVVFSTVHFYQNLEFTELLLAQPLGRRAIFRGQFVGVAKTLAAAFLLGCGLPVLLNRPDKTGLTLVAVGLFLTTIFCAFAFAVAVSVRDRARGIGAALLAWFYFALLFDGLVLLILFSFSDWPLENVTLALSCLNPIDLGRILLLMQLDISALMGYTGAIFESFFGNSTGIWLAFGLLAVWAVLPIWRAEWAFSRKDF